jgi:hypothetical protein
MFDREIFKAVMGEIYDIRAKEIGCDECFEQVDRFIQMHLSGLDAARAMPLVQEHLQICGECRDEFGALLDALRATEDPSGLFSEALEKLGRVVTPPYER